MEVIDAREAFFRHNRLKFEELLSHYEAEQQAAISLLPLFFQTNHRLLPGYNGPDTAAGIYAYKPEQALISQAQQMNSRFHYHQEGTLKNTVIDAVYLQRDALDNELIFWLVHIPTLKKDQCEDLKDKLQRVMLWLNSRDITCQGLLVTAEQLSGAGELPFVSEKYASSSLFIDQFFLEACLLAGKYPLWWLVPPEKESDYSAWAVHLRIARYVNNDEYIDLGGIANVRQSDILRQAIKLAGEIYRYPERSWLKLLLLVARQTAWPQIDSPALRLKKWLYSESATETQVTGVLVSTIHDALNQLYSQQQRKSIHYLLDDLYQLSSAGIRPLLTNLCEAWSGRTGGFQVRRLDVVDYLAVCRTLFQHIKQAFSHIVTGYNSHPENDEQHRPLNALEHHMMIYLSETDSRVAIYNIRNRPEFIIGRMLLRQQANNQHNDVWSLVIELEEGQERAIGGFDTLLSLLAWAWLNRVVDRSTQISLDCPSRMVRQIEARHVLEVLIQQIDVESMVNVNAQVFENPSAATRSLLFTNLMASEPYRRRLESGGVTDPLRYEASDNLVVNCEQLVISNWGEVHCYQYTGNQGVLECICQWTHDAEIRPENRPGPLFCFGYAAGISTFWAQRIEQVYEELVAFFYTGNRPQGRFIVRMGPEYFILEALDGRLHVDKIGQQAELYVFLEKPCEEFNVLGLERYALNDTPLRAIYERNRENVVQIFYQLGNRVCHTWVLDEKGTLWIEHQRWIDRSSYVAHWLYLMRNIRNRLKRINYQNRELPSIEIFSLNNNQLGGVEFNPVGAEAITTERSFFDIQVAVVGDEQGDRINLICDDREFTYQQYGERVITECVQYISSRMTVEGRKPVYVTDIDVPLRLYGVQERDAIQVSHFLKYKRNIESRLNQLVDVQ